jgi:hypothetical protein
MGHEPAGRTRAPDLESLPLEFLAAEAFTAR